MLSGNDFIVLSDSEVLLIYNALRIRKDKVTYGELQALGILNIVKYMERFLFKGDDET